MGSPKPENDCKQELDDSGCVQDASMTEKYRGQAHLLDLSDDVLLCILRLCSPRDLKALGHTCPRLGTLVCDRTLWHSVDARAETTGPQRLRWYLTHALCPTTRELQLTGYVNRDVRCLGIQDLTWPMGDPSQASSNSGVDVEHFLLRMWYPHLPRYAMSPRWPDKREAQGKIASKAAKKAKDKDGAAMDCSEPAAANSSSSTSSSSNADSNPSSSDSKPSNTDSSTGDADSNETEYPKDMQKIVSSCQGPQFTLNQSLLKMLRGNCENLTSLSLEYCNLDYKETNLRFFPPKLRRLSLKGTMCYNLPVNTSYLGKIQDRLPELESLDISECEWFEPASLMPLSKVPNLQELYMKDCRRLTECVAYASLATRYGFQKLRIIDTRGSPVADSEVSAFGWLPLLEELYVSSPEDFRNTSEHSHKWEDVLAPFSELDDWENEEPDYYKCPPGADEMDEDEEFKDEDDGRCPGQRLGDMLGGYINCGSLERRIIVIHPSRDNRRVVHRVGPRAEPNAGPPAEPNAGPPAGHNAEPPAEPNAGLPAEPNAGPPAGPIAGRPEVPIAGRPAGPVAGPPPAPIAGPPPAPIAGPPAGQVVGPPPAPIAGPPAGPVAGPPPAQIAGPPPGPIAEPSAVLIAEPPAGPIARSPAKPNAGPPAGPSAGSPAGPIAGPSAGPSAGPPTGPSAGSLARLIAAPPTGPPARHISGPIAGSRAAPNTRPAGPSAGSLAGHNAKSPAAPEPPQPSPTPQSAHQTPEDKRPPEPNPGPRPGPSKRPHSDNALDLVKRPRLDTETSDGNNAMDHALIIEYMMSDDEDDISGDQAMIIEGGNDVPKGPTAEKKIDIPDDNMGDDSDDNDDNDKGNEREKIKEKPGPNDAEVRPPPTPVKLRSNEAGPSAANVHVPVNVGPNQGPVEIEVNLAGPAVAPNIPAQEPNPPDPANAEPDPDEIIEDPEADGYLNQEDIDAIRVAALLPDRHFLDLAYDNLNQCEPGHHDHVMYCRPFPVPRRQPERANEDDGERPNERPAEPYIEVGPEPVAEGFPNRNLTEEERRARIAENNENMRRDLLELAGLNGIDPSQDHLLYYRPIACRRRSYRPLRNAQGRAQNAGQNAGQANPAPAAQPQPGPSRNNAENEIHSQRFRLREGDSAHVRIGQGPNAHISIRNGIPGDNRANQVADVEIHHLVGREGNGNGAQAQQNRNQNLEPQVVFDERVIPQAQVQAPVAPQNPPQNPPQNQPAARHYRLAGLPVMRENPIRHIDIDIHRQNVPIPNFGYHLVSDAAVLRFGRADNDNINYVHIGHNHNGNEPGVRPDRSNLRVLSITGFRNITDRSLEHLATAAPHLRSIDFSFTNVTPEGVEMFKAIRPNCKVVFSKYGQPN